MRQSSARTVHLVHPHPVAWKAVIVPIAEELDVALVPYSEWLGALAKCASEGSADEVDAMCANPAVLLLDFFRIQGSARPQSGSNEGMRLSTAKAERASEELARMPELTSDDARLWVAAWRASGFLPAK